MQVVLLLLITAGLHADTPTSVAPMEIEHAVEKGVSFLLSHQEPNGSWGSPRNSRPVNIHAPVPGAHHSLRTACTALCLEALYVVRRDDEASRVARERGLKWLLDELPRVKRQSGITLFNIWAHAYSVQALSRLYAVEPNRRRKQRLQKSIDRQIAMLDRYSVVDGGWNYFDFRAKTRSPSGHSVTFLNAAVLVALHRARDAGIDVPDELVGPAVAALKRMQKPDFSYLYSENWIWYPMRSGNRPPGSLGRSQACNLALHLWEDDTITPLTMQTWLDRLITRNEWLGMGRKRPLPHESWFDVAGYYYYFGHYYATGVMQQLDVNKRPPYARHLATILISHQEKDGSWWDFPLFDYHKFYGTAFTLMALDRCASCIDSPVGHRSQPAK